MEYDTRIIPSPANEAVGVTHKPQPSSWNRAQVCGMGNAPDASESPQNRHKRAHLAPRFAAARSDN